jgi:hypothetical protein
VVGTFWLLWNPLLGKRFWMSGDGRKKLTFEGFLMEMGKPGLKDSEGSFTVASQQTVERLREQYSGDPLLGYTEILQGFQQFGAQTVEMSGRSGLGFTLSARFASPGPDLSHVFAQPLSILAAECCLQSGTGLLLLQHDRDLVVWSVDDGAQRSDWQFCTESGQFERADAIPGFRSRRKPIENGTVWVELHIRSPKRLSVYCADPSEGWEDTTLRRDFVHRLAFYGCPLSYHSMNLQCPLPGRLVVTDHWSRSPIGGMGYSWIPLAYQYVAAKAGSTHYFLSEPFTGVIANKVRINDEVVGGYSANSKPDYVCLKGANDGRRTDVPFKRSWWHRSERLVIPGFERLESQIKNPRLEPPLFYGHPKGRALKCSRIHMLSTALSGNSTIVFVKHGVVLGARHEELKVPGALCIVGFENLTTDLSRRSVRQNADYDELVRQVSNELWDFYGDAAGTLGFNVSVL